LLPTALLAYRRIGGAVAPSYLTERDDVWVREVLEELDALIGRTAREVAAAFHSRVLDRARRAGASPRTVEGIWRLALRVWTLRMQAPRHPERVREAVFEERVRHTTRDAALDAAAARLGATREQVLESLFADRAESRRLVAPPEPASPRALVLRYNLALLQGLLLRAVDLDVCAHSNVRSVVRFAKLRGLLCTYHPLADGVRIALSGPLSVLRETTKYGHALAAFVPAAVATPGWTIDARCRLGPHFLRLRATASDPIASTHALPKDCDSAVERALARDVRRLGTAWTITRETTAIRAGTHVFFPDFTLSREGEPTVLVEIVGYYTPEYLSSKLRVLRESKLRRIIVCVDESLTRDRSAFCADAVLFYRRRVDAKALLAAAERVANEADERRPRWPR
jgi:predicted nuclease of restriction endonuclease-like RecB superfamily